MNLFKYIISIERKIKTYIAYEFSKNYGNKEYLIEGNFDNSQKNNIKIQSLIREIEKDKENQINVNNKMLVHYIEKYNYIPLWVLIRRITFGQVSKFYALIKQKDQNAVAKNFRIKEKKLKIYINNLAIIRNICAHDEKLFDIRLRKAISITDIHKFFDLDMKNNKKCNGFKDLFSVIIILKELLEEKEFERFYRELVYELEGLRANIKSIKFEKILHKMGFPTNYEDLL